MSIEKIIGTWSLVSMEVENIRGEKHFPFGKKPKGKIIYTKDGYMSVVYSRQDRANFSTYDLSNGTTEELKQAFEGFDAYCGTFELNEKKMCYKASHRSESFSKLGR